MAAVALAGHLGFVRYSGASTCPPPMHLQSQFRSSGPANVNANVHALASLAWTDGDGGFPCALHVPLHLLQEGTDGTPLLLLGPGRDLQKD